MRAVDQRIARCWMLCVAALGGAATLGAAEPAASKKIGEIVARVVGLDGRPASGAEVTLLSFDQDWRLYKTAAQPKHADDTGTVRFNHIEVEAYLVVARVGANALGIKDVTLLVDAPKQEVDLTLGKPAASVLRVRDGAGKPVAGAWIYSLYYTGSSGSVFLPGYSFEDLGFEAATSDAAGELELPPLPAGGRADIKIMHADYAPAKVKDVPIAEGSAKDVRVDRGVQVQFRLFPAAVAEGVKRLMLDLRRDDSDHPSMLIGYHANFDGQGVARFTIAEGDYYWLRLRHPDFVVTPTYSYLPARNEMEQEKYFTVKPGNDWFAFDLKSKVAVRGRVIDQSTGKPIEKGDVGGEVASTGAAGPLAEFGKGWSHAGWAEIDKDGRFEIKVAAGRVRLAESVEHYLNIDPSDHVVLDVAADGSTVCPDILVRPMPKVRGIVTTTDGRPVAKAVVRFTGKLVRWLQPVTTDDEGRFELAPEWMPTDSVTEERRPVQMLSAFHPHEPLAGSVEVRLDDPQSAEHVAIQLAPQEIPQYLASLAGEMTPWERAEPSAVEKQKKAAAAESLAGMPAPELDGVAWLNTDKPTLSLADLRGKYVLLDFWTTWCGPCHGDFPSVRLLHELYKDKGVVVIGVHDNSMPLDAIRADAAKEKLTFPIVVDHPDGRIVERYHIASWPTYLLIGPDGTVIRDSSVPAPSLRQYKIEIIRELLSAPKSAAR